MKDDAPRLRPRFWERFPLTKLTPAEWEALCDGCGRCCLNKLEDADTGEIAFTRVACRLLDGESCRCTDYPNRKRLVPECVVLTPRNIGRIAYWMPPTCAYRVLYEGGRLERWHPLISGNPDSVHQCGVSVQGWSVSEAEVPVDDWEEHIIAEDL